MLHQTSRPVLCNNDENPNLTNPLYFFDGASVTLGEFRINENASNCWTLHDNGMLCYVE